MVITLGDVLFGTDLARLNAEGMRTAEKLANVLQKNPQRTVLVEGFTDRTGTAAHNQDLSERRATAVRGVLQELGVARERVAIRGYGETYPIAANDTAQNRQLNRRVEIVLSDDTGKISPR
jgi:outer membrane protein OmpA-like peptidoglycan-associated protein